MNTSDLGAQVRVHRHADLGVLTLVVVCALIATAFFLVLSIQSGLWWVDLYTLVFGLVVMNCGVWWVRNAFTRVTVFERGIAWRVGRARGSCAFSEIQRVETVDGNALQGPDLRILLAGGATVRLPGSLGDRAALLASLDSKMPAAPLPTATFRPPPR